MQKPLDQIEKRFCSALRRWFENDFKPGRKGAVTRCAEFFGISQGHFSSILKGEKCWRSESERREISRKIGVPYETMIGLKPADHVAESPPPEYVNSKTAEVLRLTKEILESKTKWAVFMEKCIHEFHAAVIEQAQIEQPDKTDGGSTLAQKESMAPPEKSGKTRRYS